jgi:photosystem II stability/assembly factor-like uncharacterized protein
MLLLTLLFISFLKSGLPGYNYLFQDAIEYPESSSTLTISVNYSHQHEWIKEHQASDIQE